MSESSLFCTPVSGTSPTNHSHTPEGGLIAFRQGDIPMEKWPSGAVYELWFAALRRELYFCLFPYPQL